MADAIRPNAMPVEGQLPRILEIVQDLLDRTLRREARDGELRRAAKLFIALAVAGAVGALLIAAENVASPRPDQLFVAIALAAAIAGAGMFPLPFVARTKLCLDSALLLVTVCLLPPALAVPVVAVGAIVGPLFLRHPLEQTAFNTSLMVILAATGSAAASMLAGQVDQLGIGSATLLIAGAVGLGIWLLNTLLVAVMIALQEDESLATVAGGMIFGSRTATLAQLAEVAVGIVLVALATATVAIAAVLLPGAVLVSLAARNAKCQSAGMVGTESRG